jgi:hypothetical protein
LIEGEVPIEIRDIRWAHGPISGVGALKTTRRMIELSGLIA